MILESYQLKSARNTKEMTLLQIISGMIAISKNVTLLSFGVICGIIVISMSIIILPCNFAIGNLWHEHNQYKCQSMARRVGYFKLHKGFIHTICKMCSSKDSQDEKIHPEHYASNICIHQQIPN